MHYLPPIIAYFLLVYGALWASSVVDHVQSVRVAAERVIVGCVAIAGAYYIMMKFLERRA